MLVIADQAGLSTRLDTMVRVQHRHPLSLVQILDLLIKVDLAEAHRQRSAILLRVVLGTLYGDAFVQLLLLEHSRWLEEALCGCREN